MKLDLSLNKLDKILLSVSLLVTFTTAAYWIHSAFKDQNDSSAITSEIAGKTEKAINDVRRKPRKSMNWVGLKEGSDVFFEESIYSGQESELTIKTEKGTEIYLEPNSLVFLQKNNNNLGIDVKLGGVTALISRDETLAIQTEESLTLLKSQADQTQLKIRKNQSQQSIISIENGTIEATYNNQTINLKMDQIIIMDPNNKTTQTKSQPTLISEPTTGQTIQLKNQKTPITLKWKNLDQTKLTYVVIVSKNSEFTDIVYKNKTSENSMTIYDLNSGAYYWKVLPLQDSKIDMAISDETNAAVSFFWIKKDLPPQLAFPSDGAKIQLNSPQLVWENPGGAKNFRVQVSRKPHFQDPLIDKNTTKLDLVLSELETGTYYWRVISDDSGTRLASFARSFEILPAQQPLTAEEREKLKIAEEARIREEEQKIQQQEKIKAVVATNPLRAPRPNTQTEYFLTWNNQSNQYRESVPFSWESVDFAQSYTLKVSAIDDTGPKLLFTKTLSDNRYVWTEPKLGQYIWSVTSQGYNQTKESNTVKIFVKLAPPVIDIPTDLKCTPSPIKCQDIHFNVNSQSPPKLKVKYEVSDKSDFTNLIQGSITTDKINTLKDLEPKPYFIRSSYLDEFNQRVSDFSKTIAFKLERENLPQLAKPKLLTPVNDSVIVLIENKMTPLLFQWSADKGAANYTLQFSKFKDFRSVENEFNIDQANMLLKEKPNLDSVYWRVRANAPYRDSDWSVIQSFHFESE